jgi:hypothetical protein
MKTRFGVPYCPICKGQTTIRIIDGAERPALVCPNDHRFFVVDRSSRRPDDDPPPRPPEIDDVSPSELIRNPRYSCHVHENAWDVLRRIEEIKAGRHILRLPYTEEFCFCPRCGADMSGCEALDPGYCLGLCCPSGHRYDFRNGLNFIEADGPTFFSIRYETPDEDVLHCAKWLVLNQDCWFLNIPRLAMAAISDFIIRTWPKAEK